MHEIGPCELEDIDVVVQFANRETVWPLGIVRDVEILCGKTKYPTDFLVLGMEASKTCPIISSPHSTPAGPSQLSAAPPVPNHNEATTEAASLVDEPIASLLNPVVLEVQLRWRKNWRRLGPARGVDLL
jgi:hypothetical protein